VAAQGREGLKQLLAIIADEKDARLPIDARASVIVLPAQLQALQTMIGSIERRLLVQHRANEASKRLESVPRIGTIGASAIAATVTDPKAFRSGRDFAAWIGLVPRQDSTGGKQKLGPISKQGDQPPRLRGPRFYPDAVVISTCGQQNYAACNGNTLHRQPLIPAPQRR
jgi:transposase